MTTLITFLGRVPAQQGGAYQRVGYRFWDGSVVETAYFGLALRHKLGCQRVVLLGTSGSMWDVLIADLPGAAEDQALRSELFEAAHAQRVDDALLQRLTPRVAQALDCQVCLRIIPSGSHEEDQARILSVLAEAVGRNERVAIDVTHGYRHLAMIGLTAARFLRTTHRAEVEGLYYGALDMRSTTPDGTVPVVKLDGLSRIQEWVEAFARYEANGDFSVFAKLLEAEQLEARITEQLCSAWNLLNLSNLAGAATRLQPLLVRLNTPLPGVGELFRERLRRALRWVEASNIAEQQRVLALQALARLDFLRASIFGLESVISRLTIEAGGNPLDYEQRDRAQKSFRDQLKGGELPDWAAPAYHTLNALRNSCAHGTPPKHPRVEKLMRNPERLRNELEAILNRLTNR